MQKVLLKIQDQEHGFRRVRPYKISEEGNWENRSREYTLDRYVPVTVFGCCFGCDCHRALLGENFGLLIPGKQREV